MTRSTDGTWQASSMLSKIMCGVINLLFSVSLPLCLYYSLFAILSFVLLFPIAGNNYPLDHIFPLFNRLHFLPITVINLERGSSRSGSNMSHDIRRDEAQGVFCSSPYIRRSKITITIPRTPPPMSNSMELVNYLNEESGQIMEAKAWD